MTHWITTPSPEGWRVQLATKPLIGGEKIIEIQDWLAKGTHDCLAGATFLLNLIESEEAQGDTSGVLLTHPQVAAMSRGMANSIGLPPDIIFNLDLQHVGTLASAEFRFRLEWVQVSGQPVPGASVVGSSLRYGSRSYRVPQPIFGVVQAAELFNATPTERLSDRMAAWATMQEYLPAASVQSIRTSGYIATTRIARAAKFSLSLKTSSEGFLVEPLLFGEHLSLGDGEPTEEIHSLLPPMQQEIFAKERFPLSDECKSQYALSDGWYVVMDSRVRRALDVVRRVQKSDYETRKAFAQNPRAYLSDSLGDLDEAEIDTLFVETAEYSARVQDVGLWQPKVLPWVKRAAEKWLPESFGISVGGKLISLSDAEVPQVTDLIEQALSSNTTRVNWKGTELPVSADTLTTLKSLIGLVAPASSSAKSETSKGNSTSRAAAGQHVLVITDNFQDVGFRRVRSLSRPALHVEMPGVLRATLKPHQVEGVRWLQNCWQQGEPGCLLADDMGLGKTIQTLTFLAWIAEARRNRRAKLGPILIVAPTGLLKNWEKEHALHLSDPGLGEVLRAFGNDLKLLRHRAGKETDLGQATLDAQMLGGAQWVLTTYETLRDYQHSFCSVKFSAVVFDEIQKIKVPGTIMTHAAKALNAEFILGLTGTPVENRLADLWCIFDTIQPGFLGDLSTFSKRYEKEEDVNELRNLKKVLTEAADGLQPLMLRRMKADKLPGLPPKEEHAIETSMPDIQAQAYFKALEIGKEKGPGKMLEVLQGLRSVSLHPLHPQTAKDDAYVYASARLKATFDILDRLSKTGEKALIFVESQEMQPVLAGLIVERYGLKRTPMIINGAVSGAKRQERVDLFQEGPKGFDVIILSPRAGGVGLTLTAATSVIHLSRWWNPAVEDQCTDRAYRIGQTKPVHVYYPQAIHPALGEQSFDKRLHALLERKRGLSREMLMPPVGDGDAKTLYGETVEPDVKAARQDNPLDGIDAMEPTEFEHWVLNKLKVAGHQVSKTPKSHDSGADGICIHRTTGKKYILQCKHTQAGGAGVDKAIDDLLRARTAYKAEDAILVAITNNTAFGHAAAAKAKAHNIRLIERASLVRWPVNL